ncbi:MAG: hypothetical protein ACREB7_15380 [Sphingopyxis sp.]|jgi:hypothetical protein|uniref:hypothetical protein n=1 Tax=Sphingopyxis sp. TaxID=1908224 RepID=UPI003D6D1304
MAYFRTLAGLGVASAMLMAAPVFAATTAAAPAKPAVHAQVHQTAAAAPKAKTATAARPAAAHRSTHLAKATQRNGKKVTYNCSLAGNKNKQACKG